MPESGEGLRVETRRGDPPAGRHPHWVKNYNNVSISLNVNFHFHDRVAANIYRANYYLRKTRRRSLAPGSIEAAGFREVLRDVLHDQTLQRVEGAYAVGRNNHRSNSKRITLRVLTPNPAPCLMPCPVHVKLRPLQKRPDWYLVTVGMTWASHVSPPKTSVQPNLLRARKPLPLPGEPTWPIVMGRPFRDCRLVIHSIGSRSRPCRFSERGESPTLAEARPTASSRSQTSQVDPVATRVQVWVR